MTTAHVLTPAERVKFQRMYEWYLREEKSRIRPVNMTTPVLGNDLYIAAPPVGGIPARSGTTPGRAECQVWKIDKDHANRTLILAHPDEVVYNVSETVITDDYVIISKTKYGRWVVLAGGGAGKKGRVCVKGTLDQDLLPGEGGTMSGLVCLWNIDEVVLPGTINVLNCTDQTLENGKDYEACYNCECKFVITNCCPLHPANCPNCFYSCADNYDIILPSGIFTHPICSCLDGITVPYSFDSDCLYLTEQPGPYIIDSCTDPTWDGIAINPCECAGGPQPTCIPDTVADPDCRYCVGDGTVPCTYCRANCSHGLREALGNLNCIANNWVLNLDIGTAGPCPNISIAMTSVSYPYPANGNCPPREMNMDVTVTNDCNDPDLQCVPTTFPITVRVEPRNN